MEYFESNLTSLEKKAIKYIKEAFLINGIDFDGVIRFAKINNQYLNLSANNTVFCRIKVGLNAFWLSVYGYRLNETKKSDIRFNGVKDKNSRHWKDWKIPLKDVEDFSINSDLIVDVYKSLNISDDENKKKILEEYQTDDMEYTDLEEQALGILKNIFAENGVDLYDKFKIEKSKTKYICFFYFNTRIFKLYLGKIKKTFTFSVWELSEEKRKDTRFDKVKDKNSSIWTIDLERIEDLENYSDLIVATYKSFDSKRYRVNDKEICTASKSASVKRTRKKGNSIVDNIKDYTVIDLETTSKYTNLAEIIEMSAVRVRNGEIVDKYSTFIKPSGNISSAITAITGITNGMLENAPKIEDKIQEYLDFIGDDIILGHNIASFDSTILYDLCEKLNLKVFNNDILDTLRYSKYCDIAVSDNKLKTISEFFGIEHNAHRALNDCIANFEVYEKLKEHFTGNIILTVSGESRRERTSIENMTVNPCYSNLNGKNIVLTGEFACGQRKDVKSYFEKLGVSVKSGVSSKTDYLIIGAFGSPDWKFGDYGDKVAKAQELQLKGKPIEIIQEEEFFECQKQLV